MDPLSAGISAAGSLIGNVFGAASTNSTNKMNYRIFKESSQFNRQERIAAQDWQKKMLDYQNAYNSPLEQRKRLQEGGYNPYLNQASANLSAGLSSSPQASAPGSPTMQPFIPDMSATQQIASMLFSDPLQKANIDKIKADKEKANAETAGQLLENAFQSDSYDARKKAIELNNDLINEQKNLTHEQIDYTKAQTALLNVNKAAQEYLNQWLPIEKQMSLMTSIVSLDNMLKQGRIMERQYDKLAYDIIYQQLLNSGQATNNKMLEIQARVLKETFQNAIDSTNAMHLDLKNMYTRPQDYWTDKYIYELDENSHWRWKYKNKDNMTPDLEDYFIHSNQYTDDGDYYLTPPSFQDYYRKKKHPIRVVGTRW